MFATLADSFMSRYSSEPITLVNVLIVEFLSGPSASTVLFCGEQPLRISGVAKNLSRFSFELAICAPLPPLLRFLLPRVLPLNAV